VPKYDAFGREIGEDTLEGLGGSPAPPSESAWQERSGRDEASWQQAERVEVARLQAAAAAEDARAERAEDARQEAAGDSRWTAPAGAEPAADPRQQLAAQLSGVLKQAAGARSTPTVTVQRSGSAKGCLVAIVVVLLIGGAAAAGIVSLVNSVDIDTGGLETTIKAPGTGGPKPKGLGAGSLARRAELGAALTKLRTEGGGRLTNLRVAPERIDATLLTPAGRLRHVQIAPGGELARFGSDSGPGFDSVSTIPFGRLRPGAPQRLVRRGAEEIGVPVSDLQYLVPTFSSGELTWAAYFTRSRYVLGNSRGRFQRKYP
jgi:hypothetical protein